MKGYSLRRQKLLWCAAHNIEMCAYQDKQVKYLLFNMPDFIKSFAHDIERALDNLNQYLSSNRASYWKTRPNVARS